MGRWNVKKLLKKGGKGVITKNIKSLVNPLMRIEIQRTISTITPVDPEEMEHIAFVQKWIESGAELFRIAKPATPDTHLVAYIVLIDQTANKVLLVDHKNAGLWLPAGGHVEINEHPEDTVKRELQEELGIQADFILHDPLFLTVTQTVGRTAGHTDVSLWYVLKGCASDPLAYDAGEFHAIQWFLPAEVPYGQADPHMERFMKKLRILKFLN